MYARVSLKCNAFGGNPTTNTAFTRPCRLCCRCHHFKTVAFDEEDRAILESFADLAAVAIIRSRLLEHRIEQERLWAELEAAAKIQKLFWPKMPELGEGSHVWAFTEPAASVGGASNRRNCPWRDIRY